MKKSLSTIVLAFSFVLGGAALTPTASEAHGYVASPGSRAFLGSSTDGNLNTNVGRVQWEPQSIKVPKNTFITGKLVSAGVSGLEPLDEQTATRWYKTNVTTGSLDITWNLIAQHRTASRDYYITKDGWNPDQPLDIKSFDKIASVDGKQEVPNKVVKQIINIPTDRKGYHAICAVWGVDDTVNAFYRAIDVNIQ